MPRPAPATNAAPRARKKTATPAVEPAKSNVRHLRIPPEVYEPFAEKCARTGYGVAERVRQLMREDARDD